MTHGTKAFHGWRVVAAAFTLAVFGWGLGFYGPPIYLHAVRAGRGWSLALVSAAVTAHYLVGAIAIANLPGLYRRFGVPRITKAGALALAVGVAGWALAQQPWQLFAATLLSGAGWVALGAAAVNAIVSPWFVRGRPAALAAAYNGASIGGVVFSPLWVAAIGWWGFPLAAAVIGAVMVVVVWILADLYFAKTPQQMGLAADGDLPNTQAISVTAATARPLPGKTLWRDTQFITLAVGMALGLFAQIGLLAHLFSLLVPAFGVQLAGIAAGAATAAAIAGRSLVGWLMPAGCDRRLVACASYGVQIAGSVAFLLAGGDNVPLLLLGIVLFGAGIGNATSLPPLIAQVEFVKADVPRVVPLIVAIGQATYAFAPATFGLIREWPMRARREPRPCCSSPPP
ncbi:MULTISPECIES: MFS transporter [Rhodopseudomonas]|uniref:MFS transporter n=1 Tax=Rhodopseudomonas TaxID=1073 RepID=UPI000B0DA460|nr:MULTISPECIES: MFS transporter [Rhodopseudomonas]MDF3810440.1 MFS transporter [Rhodopseudomonas sp. BAL398]WOK19580.1 MFS transporter [Rhodopseudomonas sp. BAL398]